MVQDPPDYSSGDALPVGDVVLALLVLPISLVTAVHSFRNWRSHSNWATFFLARLGLGTFLIQLVILTSLCLSLWPPKYGARVLWFMAPLGLLFNIALTLWRMRIFRLVIPVCLYEILAVRYLIPGLTLICAVLNWPILTWIFGSELFEVEAVYRWANWGLVSWTLLCMVWDLLASAVSLWAVLGAVVKGRQELKWTCVVLLLTLLGLDLAGLITYVRLYVSTKAMFPFQRSEISAILDVSILHIDISYWYLVFIVRYMSKKERRRKKNSERHESKSSEENNNRTKRSNTRILELLAGFALSSKHNQVAAGADSDKTGNSDKVTEVIMAVQVGVVEKPTAANSIGDLETPKTARASDLESPVASRPSLSKIEPIM